MLAVSLSGALVSMMETYLLEDAAVALGIYHKVEPVLLVAFLLNNCMYLYDCPDS